MFAVGIALHLQGNHDGCWPTLCTFRRNDELVLPTPHLCGKPSRVVREVSEAIRRATKSPESQRLVTSLRTSHSESFHHSKLSYVNKRTDFWQTYEARVGLAVVEYNDGPAAVRRLVRRAFGLSPVLAESPATLQRDQGREAQRRRNREQRRLEQEGVRQRRDKAMADYAPNDLVAYGPGGTYDPVDSEQHMCACMMSVATTAAGQCFACSLMSDDGVL